MSDIPKLGKLQPVQLREAWNNEASSFTPWLHDEENMSLLGEALGLEQLIAIGREQAVGPFSADLLAEDNIGNRVLIENQLEQSDHDHLGKCLTYAAGLKAKTVVWLCSKIREEHRAAIDWLNDISNDEYSFFAVEIELYRIGLSELAPRFNVAANPNNWSREIRYQARRAETELTDTQKAHRAYWAGLIKRAEGQYAALGQRPPFKGNWQTAESMTVQSLLSVDITATKSMQGLRCEVYLYNQSSKLGFDYMKQVIEEESLLAGKTVSWERLENKSSARIAIYRGVPLAESPSEIIAEQDWIIDHLKMLASVAHILVDRLRKDPTPIEIPMAAEE